MSVTRQSLVVVLFVLVASACGGSGNSDESATPASSVSTSAVAESADATSSAGSTAGIRLIGADEGASIQADPPSDLVILDVRTPEEFGEGHLEGAILLDFYEEDFADKLGELDPDVPYLLYCRSGNRSGQTAALLKDLGFGDVADVDGGIIAWGAGGHPLVTG